MQLLKGTASETEVIFASEQKVQGENLVEFRLTYSGPLYPSTSNHPAGADHKQELRKHFHSQLKRLWNEFPHLKEMQHPLPEGVMTVNAPPPAKRVEYLAKQFARLGYEFVPLVTKDLVLACGLEILYLRSGPPGKVVQRGDLDNRVKTLFDGLKMPRQLQEIGKYTSPDSEENPFFCLVEDDSLITSLSVETDVLLEPTNSKTFASPDDARLVITVKLRPAQLFWGNIGFV